MADYKIVIPFILPSLNTYISQCYHGSNVAQKYKHSWENKIIKYFKSLECFNNVKVSMVYRWYEPDKSRDKSNISGFGIKLIEDVLVRLHIIEDDNWCGIESIESYYYVDPKKPRIEIVITVEE